MFSTRDGRCNGCRQPIPKGTPIFWDPEEGTWHWECWWAQPQPIGVHMLAERLKFLKHGDLVASLLPLRTEPAQNEAAEGEDNVWRF